MTVSDLSDAINARLRWAGPDGAKISILHIGRQTRNYATLFERQGALVRLRNGAVDGMERA